MEGIRSHFEIFERHPELVYLDNAATTHKPNMVVNRVSDFYRYENASALRGLYGLAADATRQYAMARKKVADFIHAPSAECISFTKSATEAINILANSLGHRLSPGQNVVVTQQEHHSNFIPWQQLCNRLGAEFRVVPLARNGQLNLQSLQAALDSNTKMMAVTHVSNVTGIVNPMEEIIRLAHNRGVPVMVDAAQSVGHFPVWVGEADFFVFSAHKMYGPTGVGVLYANPARHGFIKPLLFGGGMVKAVQQNEVETLPFPYSLEAGTPNIASVLGLGAAIDFLQEVDLASEYQKTCVLAQKCRGLLQDAALKLLPTDDSSAIVSFYSDQIHAHDLATLLGQRGICVRAGFHCAQPLHDALHLPATVRASFAPYNSEQDARAFAEAVKSIITSW